MGTKRQVALAATVAAALLWCAPARAAQGSFERTLRVSGPVELDVTTGSGSIHVRRGDAASVRIAATIRSSHGWFESDSGVERRIQEIEKNPPIEQHGNVIRIGHVENRELLRNLSISYDLVVPEATKLDSRTGSGGQSIDGIHGPVRASTGSGSLEISNIRDEVRAEAGSGDVRLDNVGAGLHASTGSGSIQARGVGGSFVASTGSGSIELGATGSGDGRVNTGSGSIQLTGVSGALRVETGSGSINASGNPRGDWTLHTGSGGITVQVPSGAGFDVDAHTSSGEVVTNRPITVQGTVRRGELRGKVGQGGYRMELRTGSGTIRID